MKKLIILILIVAIICTCSVAFLGCNNQETKIVNIFFPDGAPAFAIANLLANKPEFDGYEVNYQIVNGATEISAKIIQNEATFAIAPTNICSNLYNKGANIQIISANLYGVLYMVGLTNIQNLTELKGKVVYNIGRGGTPDLTFKYILSQKGLEYIESEQPVDGKIALKYVSSGAELIPLLKQGIAEFGILGEPAVTQALTKIPQSYKVCDLQALWSEATDNKSYTQACLIGNKDFIINNPSFVDKLSEYLKQNTDWVVNNPTLVQQALLDNGSLTAGTITLSAEVIKNCNINFVPSKTAKDDINKYLEVIYGFDPQFIGGKLPDDNFYYIR